jgi:hypothetical protein
MRLLILKLFFATVMAITTSLTYGEDYGRYVGPVRSEWLEDGRRMLILIPFSYIDPNGHEWRVPANSIVDGASIPQVAWSFIGGPLDGPYRVASVIHDIACDEKQMPWEYVHKTFYWAMLASRVEKWRAKVMYAAVYHFGPRWPKRVTVQGISGQTPVAEQKALEQAEPGSTARVIYAQPQLPGFTTTFEVEISPPSQTLTQNDFEELKQKIEETELASADESAKFSLKDIRAYRPQRDQLK